MVVRVGLWRRLSAEELILLNCGVGEDSWESLGLQGDPTNPFWRKSILGFLLKEWCWSWSSSGHLVRRVDSLEKIWCWEGLGAGGEGDDRGWDGWIASPTRWMRVWVNSGSWWACCDSWCRKESDTTERLNWTEMMLEQVFLCVCVLYLAFVVAFSRRLGRYKLLEQSWNLKSPNWLWCIVLLMRLVFLLFSILKTH